MGDLGKERIAIDGTEQSSAGSGGDVGTEQSSAGSGGDVGAAGIQTRVKRVGLAALILSIGKRRVWRMGGEQLRR